MKKWPILLTFLALPAGAANEGYMAFATAGALAATCRGADQEPAQAAICRQYILGAADTLSYLQVGEICYPANVSTDQLRLVVVKWLQDNPAELHLGAPEIVDKALRIAFPCPKP